MNPRFKNITVFFLLAIMLLSNLGLTANTLYCLCKGEEQVSFFEIEDDCTNNSAPQSKVSCCKKGVCHPAAQSTKKENHQCTKKGKKYVKLNSTFLLNKVENTTGHSFASSGLMPPEFNLKMKQFPSTGTKIPYKAPPPPWTRKSYLTFIQTFLC